jgi:membrane-bound metal-dependent hydrolase YbcI (DUF457 family)
VLAGAFAVVPDLDSAYTVYVHLGSGRGAVFPTTEHVWTAEGWLVHRELTHSLVVGSVTTGAVVLVAGALHRFRTTGLTGRVVGLGAGSAALVAALGGLGYASDAGLGLLVIGAYLGAALGLGYIGVSRGITPPWIGAAAAIGLLTHPFGDVFMGRPPAFLYPLWTDPPIGTIALAAEPTLNLLALFALELGLAWLAVLVALQLGTETITPPVESRAVLGIGFGLGVAVGLYQDGGSTVSALMAVLIAPAVLLAGWYCLWRLMEPVLRQEYGVWWMRRKE